MIKIKNLKEIYQIKKEQKNPSIILLMRNEDKNIIISDSDGVIHIYSPNNNFEEKLTINLTLKDNNNEIFFVSLMNKNDILITFKEIIKCISIYKESIGNEVVFKYKELFSLSLNIKSFHFFQCISLKSLDNNYIVSSCVKEIIHSWILNNNNSDIYSRYRVKKVLSVCNKDTSCYLLEIPKLKLLVSCSFKDCVLKFFDLQQNFKFISKISNFGQSYYEGCIRLINSYLFIVSGEGINGMLLIDAKYKEIVQHIQINGYLGKINSIYADEVYNDLYPKDIFFIIGGIFIDNKKIISYDFQQYEINNGEIKLINQKDNVHEEKISSIIVYNECPLNSKINKYYFWSASKSVIKIWSN